MKHIYIVSSMCLLLLFSCKKGSKNEPEPNAKKIPITFNVSAFTETYEPTGVKSNGKTTNAEEEIPVTKILYLLTNSSGKVFTTRTISKTDAGFGVFRDSVPAGNYDVIFVGGQDELKSTGVTTFTNYKVYSNGQTWNDTFYKKFSITVGNAAISQNVQLERITSQLVLNIEDAIPADVKKISFIYRELYWSPISSGTYPSATYNVDYLNNGFDVILKTTDVGKTNYQILTNTLQRGPFTATIKYYKNDLNVPFATKKINVICKANQRTTLSGILFTPQNSQFTIKFDPVWNTPVYVEF